jgi:hypothetical protein
MRPLLFHLDIAGGAPHEFETTNFYAVIITGKGLQLILTRNYPDNNDNKPHFINTVLFTFCCAYASELNSY